MSTVIRPREVSAVERGSAPAALRLRGGARSGIDTGYITRHPVFLVTFIVAIPAWIIAFAAQCAAEARYGTIDRTPVVKYLWYSIWLQLACIIHLFLAVCKDALAVHRFQLAIMLAISEVFAVYGTEFIFSNQGALVATGVGWLLLAMVDLVWILYLTSEEGTPFYRILNSRGNGGLSTHSHSRRQPAVDIGGYGGEPAAQRPMNGTYSAGGGGYGMGYSTPAADARGYTATATETTPVKPASHRDHFNPSPAPSADEQPMMKHKAKALYAYSASPDDPNEVSFNRGDILDVIDNTGKWFQVRTPSGQTGIAPSNYLSML